MNLRLIYGLIFGLLGSLVGVIVSIGVAIFVFGISYFFVFGDSPWPRWTDALYFGVIPIGVFAGVVLIAVTLGVKVGKEKEKSVNREQEIQRAWKFLFGAIAIWLVVLGVFLFWVNEFRKNNTERTQTRQENEQIVQELKASMHQIESIGIREVEEGFEVVVDTTGGIAGEYQINTRMITPVEKTLFFEKREEFIADSKSYKLTNFISYDEFFSKCFSELMRDLHCVGGNAGARFQVQVDLRLLSERDAAISNGVADFTLDYNKEGGQFVAQRLYDIKPFIQ